MDSTDSQLDLWPGLVEQTNGPFLQRYHSGQCEQVWNELMEMGEAVKSPSTIGDAWAVACETMRRVRSNIITICDRLTSIGYQFRQPDRAYSPPEQDVKPKIADLERVWGGLPLSLRAFYLIVGSADLSQSDEQLIKHMHPARQKATELQLLGEEDPLVVFPFSALVKRSEKSKGDIYFCFAPDECFKAGYGGGENYHFELPDLRADLPIIGMYDIEETFVTHLRLCFQGGGFRGRISINEQDPSVAYKVVPKMRLTQKLAEGLLPI